ncbi:BZ3500_MvSof-1268-A1-R1_Chr6-3g08910 [Microbotryum saponariae]|uniref:BZ3500_MvSof-1268-A1-R1_Chr6-3g08908 protein n=1 Tax=Microbotryum saponariae TaxID=289078 RepID=A0A2X0LD47_9BASI|nr:BZ3500_MvSof-1268-A1-R1_Chr6-3g08908 [Microbotryum saponariae]SCZ93825.1 BZ3500_MvSof-1268-A1-R1_Chr6-3g08910 [Microbotryum saponariae]SDA07510.1 BZ3501_MvSof-1269-A2-R1_Chr6-2g08612 [Microbotryum saponariae]SDA07512.1 BZ3501_MvSof-1269-A2-R1_Chr6-2g08614 [Microbotryum saponariae]
MLMLSSAVASVLAVVSLTSVADAAAIHTPQGRSIQRRKITTCRGTGQYPLPQNNVCKPCSWKFPGASTCTATAALRWCVRGGRRADGGAWALSSFPAY